MAFEGNRVILLGFTFKPISDAVDHVEIHTEVYVFGHVFTFSGRSDNKGINTQEVTPGWLFEITNGQFGKKSKFTGKIKSCGRQFTTGDYSDSFDRGIDCGTTNLSEEDLAWYLKEASKGRFHQSKYNLFTNNCRNFCDYLIFDVLKPSKRGNARQYLEGLKNDQAWKGRLTGTIGSSASSSVSSSFSL